MMLSVSSVAAQEQPEPTNPTIEYEAEIGFGTFTGIVWQTQAINYQVVAGVPAIGHTYWSTLGIQKFEALACNSTTQKVVFHFEINSLPEGLPFVYYRVRIRGFVGETKGAWSASSYWVGLINLAAPGVPVH